MIASLMMYDRPEVAGAHAAYWRLIREALAQRGIEAPQRLANDALEFDVWRAPNLVFSQTCGLPYRAYLADDVTLIGTPDFGHADCPPGYYRSAIVVRADDLRTRLEGFAEARFVYNQDHSESGYAAMWRATDALGFWFDAVVASGGHQRSARMVADNQADIAAIDAQTWRYIERYDVFAEKLRVLTWTVPTPCPPYITRKGADAELMFHAVSEAIAALEPEDRLALDLQGIVRISEADYLAVPIPPRLVA